MTTLTSMTPAQELTSRLEALASDLGTTPDHAERVALSIEIERLIPELLQAVVDDARDHGGLSWAAIGELFGITRQSAHKRFGK